jgi:hypothetical protein
MQTWSPGRIRLSAKPKLSPVVMNSRRLVWMSLIASKTESAVLSCSNFTRTSLNS